MKVNRQIFQKSAGLLLMSCCCATLLQAQTAQTSWVGRMGGASSETPTYNSVTTDNAGNVYLIGPYSDGLPAGATTFSTHNTPTFVAGGFSSVSLPYTHSNNHFVYKTDPSGNIQWVKQIASNTSGGYFSVMLNAINADAKGNVYITGNYRENVDLDPGTGVVIPTVGNSAGDNMFILKLGVEGEYIWHREFRDVPGATTGAVSGKAIKVSGAHIYTAFNFTTTKGFYLPSSSSSVANSNLTATGTGSNTGILKLDTAGNFVWVKQFSTTGNSTSTPQDIGVDASGNIYTTGFFSGNNTSQIDFNPANTTPTGASAYISAGSSDIFLSKLNSSGTYVWSKAIGSTGNDQSFSLALGNNSIYIVGAIGSPSIDFNPGGTPAPLTNLGNTDAFVASYGLDGSYKWANKYGGTNLDQANGIVCLPNGDLYIAGRVSRAGVPLDFDPQTPGNQELTAFATLSTANNTEAYILKLTSTGTFNWVYTMGVPGAGNTNDYCSAIAAHENAGQRSIYTAGSTGSTGASDDTSKQAKFPVNLTDLSTSPAISIRGTGNSGATGQGSDLFLHKAIEITCTPTSSEVKATSCGSFDFGSKTYTQTGIYTATLVNSKGCDSIVTLNLTINPTSTSDFTETACDSFEFAGKTFYQSGNYTHVFTSSQGCDSTVTVFLAVGASSTNEITETACKTYTLEAETYTESGVYTQTIPNAIGCDSFITLNLTITNPNVDVEQSDNVLTAQAKNVSYQWIDCSNNTPIAGATQQIFTAKANGNYAVIITDENCSDTSNCYRVSSVSINEINKNNSLAVYPNPANSTLNVESEINGSIRLSSVDGKIIEVMEIKKGIVKIDVSSLAEGIYLISFYDMDGTLQEVVRFSKN